MPATEPKDSDTATKTGKLKRLPMLVDPIGHAIIKRAITLRLATLSEVMSDDAEMHGAALVAIVSAWMQAEAERLRAAWA